MKSPSSHSVVAPAWTCRWRESKRSTSYSHSEASSLILQFTYTRLGDTTPNDYCLLVVCITIQYRRTDFTPCDLPRFAIRGILLMQHTCLPNITGHHALLHKQQRHRTEATPIERELCSSAPKEGSDEYVQEQRLHEKH
jgi:hypothetical protein